MRSQWPSLPSLPFWAACSANRDIDLPLYQTVYHSKVFTSNPCVSFTIFRFFSVIAHISISFYIPISFYLSAVKKRPLCPSDHDPFFLSVFAPLSAASIYGTHLSIHRSIYLSVHPPCYRIQYNIPKGLANHQCRCMHL